MTQLSVVVYLGIVLAGCAVVGIADSFSSKEVASRLRIAGCSLMFTQDVLSRDAKSFALYARATQASDVPAVVLPSSAQLQVQTCQKLLEELGWCFANSGLSTPVYVHL